MKTKLLTLRVTPSEQDLLRQLARDSGLSQANIVRLALKRFFREGVTAIAEEELGEVIAHD